MQLNWILLCIFKHNQKLEIMKTINYKGKEFPIRLFHVKLPEFEDNEGIYIAPLSLSELMGKDKEIENTEANDIDCEISYYIKDEFFDLDAKVICENYLSEPVVFICEVDM